MNVKYSNKLSVQDFKEFPVWEFTAKHEHIGLDGDLVVVPVRNLPVSSLEGRFVGTEVKLANGCFSMAVLLGINLVKAEPISGIVLYRDNEKLMFRRTASVSGAEQIAKFLSLGLEDVFPISYDISQLAVGDSRAIKGEITIGMLSLDEGVRGKDYFKRLLEKKM